MDDDVLQVLCPDRGRQIRHPKHDLTKRRVVIIHAICFHNHLGFVLAALICSDQLELESKCVSSYQRCIVL
jgi:hypothetical protein